MIDKLKAAVRWLLDPRRNPKGPHPLTLAIPDARSTFNRGAAGLAARPAASLRCPSCENEFTHKRGEFMIRCPACRLERAAKELGEFELLEFHCPDCDESMEYGIRHPNLFDSPQWAACPQCQFHWEYHHGFNRPVFP